MKKLIWPILAIALAVFGYKQYEAVYGPDPRNPLVGTWVVDLDKTSSRFAGMGATPEVIQAFRREFDQAHAHIRITRKTVAIELPGASGYPFEYDLQPSAANCYEVINHETRASVTLCIHGQSMELQRPGPGPGLIFKPQ